MSSPKKAHYETVVVLRPDMSQTNATDFVDTFTQRLLEGGASVSRREHWGLRQLAYPIKKFKRGHYFLFNHTSASEHVLEMERQFRYSEQVLRYLTVSVETAPTDPSPMMAYAEEEREMDEKRERQEKTESTRDSAPPRKTQPAADADAPAPESTE